MGRRAEREYYSQPGLQGGALHGGGGTGLQGVWHEHDGLPHAGRPHARGTPSKLSKPFDATENSTASAVLSTSILAILITSFYKRLS